MILKEQFTWLGDKDFAQANPIQVCIKEFTEGEKGYELILQTPQAKFRKIGIYTDTINECIQAFGPDTEKWTGCFLSITQVVGGKDGKMRRLVKPIKND